MALRIGALLFNGEVSAVPVPWSQGSIWLSAFLEQSLNSSEVLKTVPRASLGCDRHSDSHSHLGILGRLVTRNPCVYLFRLNKTRQFTSPFNFTRKPDTIVWTHVSLLAHFIKAREREPGGNGGRRPETPSAGPAVHEGRFLLLLLLRTHKAEGGCPSPHYTPRAPVLQPPVILSSYPLTITNSLPECHQRSVNNLFKAL